MPRSHRTWRTGRISPSCTTATASRRSAGWNFLSLLYAYVESLGVTIRFGHEVTSLDGFADADLVVGASGAFSAIRGADEAGFGTTTDWRPNCFIWYGSTKPFDSLTLTFRETAAGRS